MPRNTTTVGVTGVHVASAPKAGAVVLKELRSHRSIRAVALADYPQTCALGWMGHLASVHLVPQGILGPHPLCSRLAEIARQTPLDVVIPCDDEDVLALSRGREILEVSGIRTLLPAPEAVESIKKENLGVAFGRIGVDTPRQTVLRNAGDLSSADIPFPVIVKGRLIHAYLAQNREELAGFSQKLADVWGWPVIVQEFIDGAEFSACAVAGADHRITGLCVVRKLGISDQGKTWRAVTIAPDRFLPAIRRIVGGLEWTGPLEIEFIAPPDGRHPVVIEVNPRFPAWIAVARHAGADLVRLAVDLCLAKPAGGTLLAEPGMGFARTYFTGSFPMESMMKLYSAGSLEQPDPQ